MYKRFHDRFGTAGLVVAVLALVVALAGTAFAAAGLNSKQKKEVTKIAKKYAGKPGAPGAAGPAGPAGPKGDTGAKGDQGIQGVKGDPGSPWTVGGTLPAGESLKGDFNVSGNPSAGGISGLVWTAVSFGIPVENEAHEAPDPFFIGIEEGEKLREEKFGEEPGELCEGKGGTELTECEEKYKAVAAACPGTPADPAAAAGDLCVYAAAKFNTATELFGIPFPQICSTVNCAFGVPSADRSGFGLESVASAAGFTQVRGSWAVTAE